MSVLISRSVVRAITIAVLTAVVLGGVVVLTGHAQTPGRVQVVAYFDNSNGIFTGDDVRIRGVNVGRIDTIEPEGTRVKIAFWFDDRYPVPADAKAVILSPTLVTSRAIQLTPPYRGGETLTDRAVIPQDHTAVPVEWDDFRVQLEKLTRALQPTEAGGVSTLGAFVNTAADNLRDQGPAIRDAILTLSRTLSALGDHSDDMFTSVKNLATLVSALQNSTDIIRALNINLSSISAVLTNSPEEIGHAVQALDDAAADVSAFIAENRESLGTTSDTLTSVSHALNDSLGDVKQLLHVGPNSLANAINIYQPAQGSLSGVLAVNNFANPISFLCGAIQAASRLNAEQSSKLCVQYLGPIVKNRQYNFPPLGFNPVVGTSARPNEITYSEDRLRPDFVPPSMDNQVSPPPTQSTDPSAGLPAMMLPAEQGPR